MDNQVLPPMPPSDDESLAKNRYDGFYKTTAREMWADAQIIRIEDKPYEKHEHNFAAAQGGAKCTKCHFGLLGQFEIQNGKLFYKGEPIGL